MKISFISKVVVAAISVSFCFLQPGYANFLDSVSESLSKAGDAILETAEDVVDSAKSVGEDIGVLEKEEEAPAAPAAPAVNKSRSKEQKAEKEDIAQEQEKGRQAEEKDGPAAQASCDEWRQRLEQFMGGDKGLMAYATEDMQLIKKWRLVYAEARTTVKDYPQGLCSSADSAASYVQKKLKEFDQIDAAASEKLAADKADEGAIVFSASPISDPDSVVPQTSFVTGDDIYGIIRLTRPWTEIYNKEKGFDVRIDVKIDGKKIHAQFVTINSSDYSARNWLIFNIAPKPSELKAYSDANITYGKSTPTTVQGPNEMTHHLGALSPGVHTFEFSMYYYGKTWAAGEFSIEGNDFNYYARLHETIAKGVVAARTMPAAKMQNSGLEDKMISLLKEAGWDNVYRLNIIDKDWWIERVNGGNTPVKSRYMAAAAMTRKADGSYCYRKCKFHQDKLISGAFGELYLSHQGDEVPIDKENIDK